MASLFHSLSNPYSQRIAARIREVGGSAFERITPRLSKIKAYHYFGFSAGFLVLSGWTAEAQTRVWDGSTSAIWGDSSNWGGNNVPDTAAEAARFNATGSGQPSPTLNANVTLGQLEFRAAAPSYSIIDSGNFILSLSPAAAFADVGILVASGSANQSIATDIDIITSQSWIVRGSASLTVSGVINDPVTQTPTLTKAGSGTLSLTGDNRYDGGTVVNAGTLIVSGSNTAMDGNWTVNGGTLRGTTNATAFGDNPGGANTLGLSGGNLELANDTGLAFGRNTEVTANATITSDRLTSGAGVTHTLGTLGIGAQTLSLAAGANATSGTAGLTFGDVTLSGSPTFSAGAGTQLTMAAIDSGANSRSLGFTGNGNFAVTGIINDATVAGNTTSLTKSGTGTLTLSGANTFEGTTTISNGTLNAAAADALGSTSGVTIESGATLNLGASNTVNNSAAITLNGGSIVKGSGISEGTAAGGGFGALTLSASSTIDFGTGGVGVLAFNGFTPGGFSLSILNWTGVPNILGSGSTDRLIVSGDQTANLSAFNFVGYETGGMQISLGGGLYEIVPVPEPGAVLAAVLLLAPVAWRERRAFLRVRQVA